MRQLLVSEGPSWACVPSDPVVQRRVADFAGRSSRTSVMLFFLTFLENLIGNESIFCVTNFDLVAMQIMKFKVTSLQETVGWTESDGRLGDSGDGLLEKLVRDSFVTVGSFLCALSVFVQNF